VAKEAEYWGLVAIVGPAGQNSRHPAAHRHGEHYVLERHARCKDFAGRQAAACAGELGSGLIADIKRPPGGGALMGLLFSLPEGVAEQGLHPQARIHARMHP